MPTIPWPPARVADLVRLKANGLHHRKIAAALTEKYGHLYTREAISGKVDRLGIADERKTFWTDDRTATLQSMHGKFSFGVISRYLGTSRNSVISKARRMGLSGNAPVKLPRPRKERAAVDVVPRSRPGWRPKCEVVIPPIAFEPSPETRCSLMDLTSTTCRFPYGDVGDSGFAFCGARSVTGVPYCDFHMRKAYRHKTEARP